MERHYFKASDQTGTLYFKLRYFTPSASDKCYEAIILRINNDGTKHQLSDNLNEKQFKSFQHYFQTISEDEFNTIQESHFLKGGSRKNHYDKFFKLWNDYLRAKKKSADTVRASNPSNNGEFYSRLISEWIMNDVEGKSQTIAHEENLVTAENNISLNDVWYEARHQAVMEYIVS